MGAPEEMIKKLSLLILLALFFGLSVPLMSQPEGFR
jgi:hypothetical protein